LVWRCSSTRSFICKWWLSAMSGFLLHNISYKPCSHIFPSCLEKTFLFPFNRKSKYSLVVISFIIIHDLFSDKNPKHYRWKFSIRTGFRPMMILTSLCAQLKIWGKLAHPHWFFLRNQSICLPWRRHYIAL
jgi:hypothetical protein